MARKSMTTVFAGIQHEIIREVGTALFKAGERMQVAAQISITAGSVSGAQHEPSEAGKPPNNDTGVLANNIETVSVAPLVVEVTSRAPYAAALEFGSERNAQTSSRSFAPSKKFGPRADKFGPVKIEFGDSKTEARPYMKPAADAEAANANKIVQRAVTSAVRKATRGTSRGRS